MRLRNTFICHQLISRDSLEINKLLYKRLQFEFSDCVAALQQKKGVEIVQHNEGEFRLIDSIREAKSCGCKRKVKL